MGRSLHDEFQYFIHWLTWQISTLSQQENFILVFFFFFIRITEAKKFFYMIQRKFYFFCFTKSTIISLFVSHCSSGQKLTGHRQLRPPHSLKKGAEWQCSSNRADDKYQIVLKICFARYFWSVSSLIRGAALFIKQDWLGTGNQGFCKISGRGWRSV